MSDYCSSCRYDVKIKTGEKACPFNPLYWDFLHRNREKLEGNPRITQMYRIWDKISADKKQDYLDSADVILSKLN
jgi:deoxyribodipyrimidine photolyase-related protein